MVKRFINFNFADILTSEAETILLQSGINLTNLTNNIPNINLPQNNISNLVPQNQQQQLIQNILLI